ncbi:MAG TPA: alpha/beta fold hydrolase [Myxococcota bacterium]|nr:alpha/beta fold hydrolase [Myxococcota bacterium]
MVASWKELYPFSEHWIDANGGRQHYVDEGKGDPILFVHGNPTWSFYWRAAIVHFRDRYRCVAPDHIGCGRSDKPQDWSYRLADHIGNLENLVLKLDLRNITLVVHDWGGAIGLGMAGRHPDRIARLCITNTAAFPSSRIPLRIAMCRIPGFGALAVQGFNGFAGAATIMASEKGLSPQVKAGLLAPYDSWANRIATLRFVEDIPMDPAHPSYATLQGVEQGLARLSHLPTTLCWGEKDWCFTPHFREEFQRRMPAAEVVKVEEAGHYVMEDAPERVQDCLEQLLKRSA